MKEGEIGVIARDAARVVGPTTLLVDPTFRNKLLCVRAPKFRKAVDGPGSNIQTRASGDGLRENGGGFRRDPDCDWNGWVETECFAADSVEVWKGLKGVS